MTTTTTSECKYIGCVRNRRVHPFCARNGLKNVRRLVCGSWTHAFTFDAYVDWLVEKKTRTLSLSLGWLRFLPVDANSLIWVGFSCVCAVGVCALLRWPRLKHAATADSSDRAISARERRLRTAGFGIVSRRAEHGIFFAHEAHALFVYKRTFGMVPAKRRTHNPCAACCCVHFTSYTLQQWLVAAAE